jgi:hypothetical protein
LPRACHPVVGREQDLLFVLIFDAFLRFSPGVSIPYLFSATPPHTFPKWMAMEWMCDWLPFQMLVAAANSA